MYLNRKTASYRLALWAVVFSLGQIGCGSEDLRTGENLLPIASVKPHTHPRPQSESALPTIIDLAEKAVQESSGNAANLDSVASFRTGAYIESEVEDLSDKEYEDEYQEAEKAIEIAGLGDESEALEVAEADESLACSTDDDCPQSASLVGLCNAAKGSCVIVPVSILRSAQEKCPTGTVPGPGGCMPIGEE